MSRSRIAVVTVFALGLTWLASDSNQSFGFDEPSKKSKPRKIEYALVLHGGAGTAPSQYSDEKNRVRRKSLETALFWKKEAQASMQWKQ